MGIEQTLGSYGDLLFGSALAVYVVAMVLHAVEHGLLRRTDAAPSAEPVAVAATVGGVADAGPVTPPGGDDAGTSAGDQGARRTAAERAGRVGVALTVLGLAVHGGSLLLRGYAAGRTPLGNMYEFTSAICLVAAVAWLVLLQRRPELRRVGVFVLLPVIVLMFLAGTVLYAQTGPVVPALRSYWLSIHVTAAVISSGILLVAGVASCLYLVRAAHERTPSRMTWSARLPEAAVLDRVAYRATAIAFPIWTFAVIAGAIWAEAAWGRYWGWDPKETTAFIAWVVYACYLHARSTAGWRGAPATTVNIVGFAVMIFNLFFINIVISGLHSYAGV